MMVVERSPSVCWALCAPSCSQATATLPAEVNSYERPLLQGEVEAERSADVP